VLKNRSSVRRVPTKTDLLVITISLISQLAEKDTLLKEDKSAPSILLTRSTLKMMPDSEIRVLASQPCTSLPISPDRSRSRKLESTSSVLIPTMVPGSSSWGTKLLIIGVSTLAKESKERPILLLDSTQLRSTSLRMMVQPSSFSSTVALTPKTPKSSSRDGIRVVNESLQAIHHRRFFYNYLRRKFR